MKGGVTMAISAFWYWLEIVLLIVLLSYDYVNTSRIYKAGHMSIMEITVHFILLIVLTVIVLNTLFSIAALRLRIPDFTQVL